MSVLFLYLEWVSCQSIFFVCFSSGKSMKEEGLCALPSVPRVMEIQCTLNDYLLMSPKPKDQAKISIVISKKNMRRHPLPFQCWLRRTIRGAE